MLSLVKSKKKGYAVMMNRKRAKVVISVILAAMIAVVYFNLLDNEATNWDDPALFSRTTIHSITIENLKNVLAISKGSTYQPVRDLTYMLDFELWGDNVVLGMHIHSIVLYYLMVLCCWLFLMEFLRFFCDDEKMAFTWATMAAVIFAVHPVHVESVAWLYSRKEPLMGIFSFLSLWAFIRARIKDWRYYIPSVIMMIIAILSKPTALILPGIMIVLDFVIASRSDTPHFIRYRIIVFGVILLIVGPMIYRLISMMYSVGGVKPYHGGSIWTNLLAVSQIFISYINLIVFTINYSADYPIRLYADPHMWQAWVFVILNIVLVGSAVAALIKKRYVYAVFVAWHYIFLLPVCHIFPISQTMADRYALMSSLSWCVFIGYILSRLWYCRLENRVLSPEFPKLLSVSLLGFMILSYGYMTHVQNDIWQNSQTLWEDTLAKYPNSNNANVNLSAIYIGQGRFQEVQEMCIRAIKNLPYDYLAISNLALAQMMMGQYDHAIHNYEEALKLKPGLMKAKMGLANAYWLNNDYKEAYALYSEMIKYNTLGDARHAAASHYRMGYMSWRFDMKADAYRYLEKASMMARDNEHMLKDLAEVYTSMGDIPRALHTYRQIYPLLKDKSLKEKLADLIDALQKYPAVKNTE